MKIYADLIGNYKSNRIKSLLGNIVFSEIGASIVVNTYNCRRNSVIVVTAQLENYLTKTLSKCWKQLNFLNDYTEGGFFKLRQVKDTDLVKKASVLKIVNGQKVESGWMSEITGIIADKPSKIRGDRTDLLIYEESGCFKAGTKVLMANGSISNIEDIKLGDLVMGDDGTPRTVLETHTGKELMYKIVPKNGNVLIVNENHIIYGKYRNYSKNTYEDFLIKAKDYYNMIKESPRKADGYKLIKSNKVKFSYKEVPIDPYLFGFWLGNGHSDDSKFTTKDSEIIEYLKSYANNNGYKYHERECENSKGCYHIRISKLDKEYKNKFKEGLRELNVFNNKYIPDLYLYNSEEVLLQLLAGLIDAGGSYNKSKHEVEFTQLEERKDLVSQVAFICRSLGMKISEDIKITKDRKINGKFIKGGTLQYRIRILHGHSIIPTKIKRKQSSDRELVYRASKDKLSCTFTIEPYKVDNYYGFTLDGNHLFLLEDFTIVHNSWPKWKKAFEQGDALVGIQGAKFGIKMAWGTGR